MDRDTDYIASLGRPFAAHRLRRLSDMFLDAYSKWLPGAGISAPARSLSTLLLLSEIEAAGVTELAARLRLTHPFMIKMVAALEADGLVAIESDASDGRRRPVRLTPRGEEEVVRIRLAVQVLDESYAELFRETGIELIDAAARIEDACLREPFRRRLERAAAIIGSHEERQCDTIDSPSS